MSFDWSLHDQESRKKVNEDSSDPGGHQVGLGRPEVDVENHNSHTNAEKFTFEDKHRDSHQSEEDKYANIIQE